MKLSPKVVTIFLAVTCAPSMVHAICPSNAISSALTARLDKSSLPILDTVLVTELPTSIAIPSTPYTLLECPIGFDNTVVKTNRTFEQGVGRA
jgi:hypothetical protein